MPRPSFLRVPRNVSVMAGEPAFLPCRVKQLAQFTVSWLRAADVTVLSVGHLAFSSDPRIGIVQVRGSSCRAHKTFSPTLTKIGLFSQKHFLVKRLDLDL